MAKFLQPELCYSTGALVSRLFAMSCQLFLPRAPNGMLFLFLFHRGEIFTPLNSKIVQLGHDSESEAYFTGVLPAPGQC